MRRLFGSAAALALVAVGGFGLAPQARADAGVNVGTLTCNVDSGWGFIFGSSRGLKCVFSNGSGNGQHYTGTISKFGVDIGYTQSAVIVWGVVAAQNNMQPGGLAGEYAGVTGSATAGVGAGASVLVGGFNKSFTLQPVSIQGSTGLNVAAGIEGLSLKFEPG
jgi:hypothetical protein